MRDSQYSVGCSVNFAEWAFGWCDIFSEFGIGAMAFGPFTLHLTWPISE